MTRPGTHRVLVKTGERIEGAGTVETYEYVEATAEQAIAYTAGDANWRQAKANPWYSRLWHRVTGGDAG